MAVQDTFVSVSGIKTRYRRAGASGPDVVLIHGIASSVEDWGANIEALAASHRVHVLDLVGCGLSDKPHGYDYSPESLAAFVLEFMTAIGLEKADLVGFSLGGHVALRCALVSPHRVRSLVLSDPAGMGRESIINFRVASIPGIGEVLVHPIAFGIRNLMKTAFYDASKVTDEIVEHRLRLARMPGAKSAFLKMLRSLSGVRGFHMQRVEKLQKEMARIRCPVLVIWGEQDRFVPAAHAGIVQRCVPGAVIRKYDKCGHLPQAELPERFNRDVLEFLENTRAHSAVA